MEFTYQWLSDPTVFGVNKLPPHAACSPRDGAGRDMEFLLDGEWAFAYATRPDLVPSGFTAAGYDLSSCARIRVPGHIQMQGGGAYGTPQYTNVRYPWDGWSNLEPPAIPTTYNPVGCYARDFAVPADWTDYVRIRFDGAETAIAVWCNGAFVGYSENSFCPAEFDLTDLVRRGEENRLAVLVFRFTTASWLEDQDFWRFSGIQRSVHLIHRPKAHIADFRVDTPLADDFQSGALEVKIKTVGAQDCIVSLDAFDDHAEATVAGSETTLSLSIEHPLLWSAEQPNLYPYTLTLRSPDGEVIETIAGRAGLRRFELRGNVMHLNGKRIVFKGVNRHEWNCHHGRVVSREDMLWDIQTMKRHNINAVRTSHYPNRTEWYDLCDEYGLYVIDETNLETHGTWTKHTGVGDEAGIVPGSKPEWRDAVLDRAAAMLERDKNHPSILIWSCGNESYVGENIRDMARYFHKADPTRLVHYEGASWKREFNDVNDMESRMYTPKKELEEFLRTEREKPLIMCEYSHAMGNSCGDLEWYTEYAYQEPLYQGGFIWEWIDHSIAWHDPRTGTERMLYGGDFGDVPTEYSFCVDGLIFGERACSEKMQEVKGCYQDYVLRVGAETIELENRSLFTDTACYDLCLTLRCNGAVRQTMRTVLACAPGEKASMAQPFTLPGTPGLWTVDAALCLREPTLWAEEGHEVAFGQYVCDALPEAQPAPGARLVEGDATIGVHGEDFTVLFLRSTGRPVSYKKNGRELLLAPAELNFWRAPIDNDRGWNMPFEMAEWKTAGLYPKVEEITTEMDGLLARIHVRFSLPTGDAMRADYAVDGAGRVEVTLTWDGRTVRVPEFGMLFYMDAAYDRVTYLGEGPDPCAADRRAGARVGCFAYDVAAQHPGNGVPQDYGVRTGVRSASVEHGSDGLRFMGDGMYFSALPYTPHQLEAARHRFELPPYTRTIVRCAGGQMGVGGDDSWGAKPHDNAYCTLSAGTTFTFTFTGI